MAGARGVSPCVGIAQGDGRRKYKTMCSAIADSPLTIGELARVCAATPPRPHHAALLAAIHEMWPGFSFRRALTRGGWYRPGGLITESGERLSDDLQRWTDRAWQSCGGDGSRFVQTFGKPVLLATRITGRTHYFVAAYGRRATEFLQLEIEELEEVTDRRLFDPDEPPEDPVQLAEPERPLRVEPRPLGPARYALRRLADIHSFLGRLQGQSPLAPPVVRFLAEWDASSAGRSAHFSDEWVLALAEHLDRFKQPRLTAKPVPAPRKRSAPPDMMDEKLGADLGAALHIYDRHAGYPFAWYFHLVANRGVNRAVASHVAWDLAAGYDYLPRCDAELVSSWMDAPYSV